MAGPPAEVSGCRATPPVYRGRRVGATGSEGLCALGTEPTFWDDGPRDESPVVLLDASRMADEALTKHPDNTAGKTPPDSPAPRARWWLPSGPVLGLVAILLIFAVLIFLKDGAWGLRSFVGLRNWQVIVHEGTITAVIALG